MSATWIWVMSLCSRRHSRLAPWEKEVAQAPGPSEWRARRVACPEWARHSGRARVAAADGCGGRRRRCCSDGGGIRVAAVNCGRAHCLGHTVAHRQWSWLGRFSQSCVNPNPNPVFILIVFWLPAAKLAQASLDTHTGTPAPPLWLVCKCTPSYVCYRDRRGGEGGGKESICYLICLVHLTLLIYGILVSTEQEWAASLQRTGQYSPWLIPPRAHNQS